MRLVLLVLLLSGCTTTVYRDVKIPIPVPCIEASGLPARPVIPDNHALAALDDYRLVLQLATDRLELLRHNGELSALIQACVK